MLFKAVLLFDDCDFSGKSLKQSLPHHQLSLPAEGKCMPKAEASATRKAEHPSFKGALGGLVPLLPVGQCFLSLLHPPRQESHYTKMQQVLYGREINCDFFP